MNVVVTPEAREEIATIRDAIALDRPRIANEWVGAVFRRLRVLRRYPRAGRVVPEFADADLRELVIGNYRVWYRIARCSVRVLHFFDARRSTLPETVEESVAQYAVL